MRREVVTRLNVLWFMKYLSMPTSPLLLAICHVCIAGLMRGTYYRTVQGVKYDRKLLEKAETFAATGNISYEEAQQHISCFTQTSCVDNQERG